MGSESQDGAVRRSLWVLVASILVVGGLGAGEARGDIQVHVMNCADSSTVKAEAFDAKDSVKMTPASSTTVATGASDSLHCAGEGKGYCEMTISWKGTPERCYSSATSSTGLKLDSGKWAVIKGFEIVSTCQPIVGQYDSQPKCQDVCGNCL
jgi:hypothetical protein